MWTPKNAIIKPITQSGGNQSWTPKNASITPTQPKEEFSPDNPFASLLKTIGGAFENPLQKSIIEAHNRDTGDSIQVPNPISTVGNIATNTWEGIKGGYGQGKQGVDAMVDAVNPAYPHQNTTDRVSKGVGGAFDLIGGGLGAAFSPASAVIKEAPPVEAAVGWGMEKINEGAQFGADKFKEHLGIDSSSEQGQAIDKGFNILANLLALKYGDKATEGAGKVFGKAVDIAKPIVAKGVELTGKAAGKTADVAGMISKEAVAKASGLNSETVSTAIKSPEALKAGQQVGADTMRQNVFERAKTAIEKKKADLSTTGSGYDSIRKSNVEVKLPDPFFDQLLGEKGLTVEGGKITANANSTVRAPADLKGIQQVYDMYGWKTKLTPNEILNLRSDLSELSKYGEGKTTSSKAFARDMRAKVDEIAKNQIPELSKLDAEYAPQVKELNNIKKLIYNKGGMLKDNAMQTVNNLLGKGKESMLARMEEVTPGITQDLKIVKALQDIELAKGQKVGSYSHAMLSDGALLTQGPVVGVLTHILTSPSVVIPILETYGRISKKSSKFIKDVTETVKAGEIPKGAQAEFVKQAIKKTKPEAVESLLKNPAIFMSQNQKTT